MDKIETDRFGQKFIWKVAVPCKQPEPDHGLDDEMYEILKAIGEFSKGTEAAIPALPVSKVTGLPLQVVEDHYELLGNESLVEHIHDSSGHYAWLKPRGRNLLRGISMVKNGSQIVLPDGIHESLAKFWSFAFFPSARRTGSQIALLAIETPGATRGHRGKWIMS